MHFPVATTVAIPVQGFVAPRVPDLDFDARILRQLRDSDVKKGWRVGDRERSIPAVGFTSKT